MNMFLRILSYIIGTILVLFVWWSMSDLVIYVLDFNLWAIKSLCGFIPAPYGKMTESALRLALHADKALLFAEGIWLARAALAFIFSPGKNGGKVHLATR